MINRLLSAIAPHHCCGCGELGAVLCLCCKNNISDEQFARCIVCNIPTKQYNLCSKHTLPYQVAWCVGERDELLASVIDIYKFRRAKAAYRVLAELLNECLPDISDDITVTWVPTAPRNIRIRGYDHMELVAKHLAKLRDWPVASTLRRRNNATQHFTKSATERRRQAVGFFEPKSKLDPEKTYLLIDDIYTTGSTLAAAAKCLREAGASKVWAGVIARQIRGSKSGDTDRRG